MNVWKLIWFEQKFYIFEAYDRTATSVKYTKILQVLSQFANMYADEQTVNVHYVGAIELTLNKFECNPNSCYYPALTLREVLPLALVSSEKSSPSQYYVVFG